MMLWTKNLKTNEEKQRFEGALTSARPVLERLAELLSEEEESLTRSEMNIEEYYSYNWSHLQAHKNGQRSILRRIKRLINLDQQKEI